MLILQHYDQVSSDSFEGKTTLQFHVRVWVIIGHDKKCRVLNLGTVLWFAENSTANNRVTRVDTIGMICLGRLTPKNETALLQRVIMFFIVRAAKNRINKCGAEHFQFNELDRTSTNSLKVVNTIFDHYKKIQIWMPKIN